ncbi:PREDICTED: sorting nexin-25-like isoform X2 [Priapulus caudatus]|uniref:Sorting nexin-25-like isoform X2 n=1 Tax=Priapulus caudatus TaxID=37621 RepID=A0ABM1E1E8_PRICU|nr:PREDICTED: sorting nexin-25-like isoform X2 [Priapulus caudatus]
MSVVLVLGSVLYQLNVLIVIVQVAFVLTCMLAGAAVGFRLFIRQQRIHEAQVEDVYRSPSRELFIKILEEEERKQQEENRDAHAHPVIISLAVDQALGEAIQLTMRDYVISWYQEISNDTNEFSKVLEADVWEMLQQLTKKSRDIDKVQVISQDVVQKLCDHFRSIRHCSSRNEMFSLHPCLMSEETETEYLRQACDVILVLALPAKHQQASVIRYLLREVMLSVLKPCIDMVCDPDYINQKLVIWLESRETEYETHRRTYAYAATYETFIKMINACTDIEQLKQIRYHIITEIMQATVINNWKKAQGIETDRDAQPTSSAKGALLKARNLHRYIKQCRYAKAQCEYRIRMLGGAEYLSYRSRERQAGVHVPGKKALSFTAIMETVEGRKAFLEYLQRTGLESLLEFWEGVEKLRSSPKVKQHGVATELYQRHLLSSSSSAVKLDRAIVKHMEAFLVADKGPEGFYEAQQELFDTLEDRFYPSFLVSDVYNSYVGNMYDPAGASRATPDAAADESNARSTLERQASEGPSLGQQCVYAQRKLTALEERFRNKSRALQALRNSHRPDPKTIGKLEQAVQEMTQEQLQLQSHIDRTETWSENCSCWRVEIDGYQVGALSQI